MSVKIRPDRDVEFIVTTVMDVTEMETETADQWLREQTRGQRYEGFFITAVAENDVIFSDVRVSLDEAREVANGLLNDIDPAYHDIEIWNNNCTEIVEKFA